MKVGKGRERSLRLLSWIDGCIPVFFFLLFFLLSAWHALLLFFCIFMFPKKYLRTTKFAYWVLTSLLLLLKFVGFSEGVSGLMERSMYNGRVFLIVPGFF